MKKLYKNAVFLDILFVFIISLTPLLWFRENTIMVGHDNVYPLEPITFLQGRLSTWIDHNFGQSQTIILGSIPVHFIDAAPKLLGLGLQVSQKIVYVFWFFLIGISMYILAFVLNAKSHIFKLATVILYQFNFFILQGWWVAERTKFSAYIAFPLILSIFIKVYRGELGIGRGAIFASLILFLFNGGGFYGIPLYGGFFIGILTFIIFFSAISFFRKQYHKIKNVLLLTVFSIIGYIVVNAYFVLPVLPQFAPLYINRASELGGGITSLVEWAEMISANTSYINLMRLQGVPEWYDNPEHPYAKYYLTNYILILTSFIWPLLIFFSLILNREKHKLEIALYFFILYLIAIFFASGTHPPLGFIYAFFIKKIPGFAIFRSPYYKFAPSIILASSILIGMFLDRFHGRLKNLIFIVMVLIIFIFHFPYFTGDFFEWKKGFSTRLSVPNYVFEFGKWLNNEKMDDARVLMVPPNSPDLQYSRYKWGYLSFQALPTLLSNSSVVINDNKLNYNEKKLLLTLYTSLRNNNIPLMMKLASLLRIKYIVFQKDAYNDKSSFSMSQYTNYSKILRNNFQFRPVKNMGEWDIYEIENEVLPKIFFTQSLYSINTDLEVIGKYYDFFSHKTQYIIEEDLNGSKAQKVPSNMMTSLVVPSCLNCPYKNRPGIIFPERNILPDSLLYPVMLFFEKQTKKSEDHKSNIYHSLGLSLKRVSEINEMIIHNKALSNDVIEQYLNLLREIRDNFQKLPTLQDKVEVGDDISYYLRSQRNFLRPNLGTYVTRGEQTIIVGKLFWEIALIEKIIEPFIIIHDSENERLFQFNQNSSDSAEVLLRIKELQPSLLSDSKVSIEIDQNLKKEFLTKSFTSEKTWISLDKVILGKGFHTILLSFSELPNSIASLTPVQTEFNPEATNKCYGTKIKNFSTDKIYKAKVSFINDFSDNLLMFVWELKGSNKQLTDALKLPVSGLKEKIEEIIKPSLGVDDVVMALCAPNLTDEYIEDKFTVEISEVIYPTMLVKSSKNPEENIKTVDFRQIRPTKYEISYNIEKDKPQILVFMERFDEGWELSGYENTHFRVDGYANGWVVNGDNRGKLFLEYKPQMSFYYGVGVSVAVLGLGSVFLLWSYRKR